MFENSSDNHGGGTVVAQKQEPKSGSSSKRNFAKSAGPGRPQGGALAKIQNFRVEFGPSRKDILNFTNQLTVMVRAGISLQDSLEAIAEQVENLKFQVVIVDLKERIESGQSFSQALAEHSGVFSSLYINMVAAAAISGSTLSWLAV